MSSRKDKLDSSINSGKRELENRLSENKERIRNLDKQLATMDALHFPAASRNPSLRTFTNGKIQCVNEAEGRSSSSSMEDTAVFSGHQYRRSISSRDDKEKRQERSHRHSRRRSRERRSSGSVSRDHQRRISSSYTDKRECSRDRKRQRIRRSRSPASNHHPEKRSRNSTVNYDRRSPESSSSTNSTTSSMSSRSENRSHCDSLQVAKPWVLPEPKDTLEHPTAYERLALERFETFFSEVATILGTRLVCSRTYTYNGMQSVSIGFEKIPPEFLQGVCAAIEGFDKDIVDLRCYQLLVTHFVKMGIFHDDFPSLIYCYKSFGSFIANHLRPLCEKLLSQQASESFRSLRNGNIAMAVGCFQELMRIESAAFWRATTRRTVDSFVSYQRSDYKEAVSRVRLDRPSAPKCVSISGSSTTIDTASGSTIGPPSLMNLSIPPPMMQLAHSLMSSIQSHPPHMTASMHLYPGPLPQMVPQQIALPCVSATPCTSSFNGPQIHNPLPRDDFCKKTDDFLANLAERNREDMQRQRNESDRSDSPPPRFLVPKSANTSTSFGSPIPLPKTISHNAPILERNAFRLPTESVYIYPLNDTKSNGSSFQSRKRNRSQEPDDDYDLVFA